ncbi:MAG: IS91 family transposase [Clostridiaceae bacterium]|nr:IS91 family transposase [Clostridiaceae bacterium]
MTKPTVQDIFHRFYPRYLEHYAPSSQQSKVAHCIINCKTGAYGTNVSICEDCGQLEVHYNSCRNRCCPMCQALPKEKWIDKRREDVLDAPYFHVVFTVPQELNPIIYSNQQLLYDALYHSVSATINELTTDSKHLGAKVGYICFLHTWGSEMNYHPHIHVILLGGGLSVKNEWRDKGEEFFLPVKVLSKVFRGKYMNEFKSLYQDNKLEFHGSGEKYRNSYNFKELLNTCYEKDWIPHCKKTFNGAQSVINYLGKYTHRIAISNHRIIRMDEDTVTYYVKDYREHGKWKELTISGVEFVRRFLMHVPPKRFVRIRHYGLLCTRSKNKHLTLCRNLLGCKKYISILKDMEAPQIIETLYGIKLSVCKCCGGHLGKPHLHMPLRI